MRRALVSAMGLSRTQLAGNSWDELADATSEMLADRSLQDGIFALAIRDSEDSGVALHVGIQLY